jgi:hypothetical protein
LAACCAGSGRCRRHGLERHQSVLSDETQDAKLVIVGRAPRAREILGVHLEDSRNEDPPSLMVNPTIPFAREKLFAGHAQGLAQAIALVSGRAHRRAAVRAAVDREVNARLAKAPAQDFMLEIIEAHRLATRDVPTTLKELAIAVFHTDEIGYSCIIA